MFRTALPAALFLIAISYSFSACQAADNRTAAAVPGGREKGGRQLERREARAHLSASASFNSSLYAKDFELGVKALDLRLYPQAEERLKKALDQLNKKRDAANLKALARLNLAEAYLAMGNLARAKVMLDESKALCLECYGADSTVMARFYADFCEYNLENGQTPDAANACNLSLKILESKGSERELALARVLHARVLFERAYYEEARESFKKALPVLELEPGNDRLDYANAVAGLAQVEKKLGNESESALLMKKALAIKDDAVVLDKTQNEKGLVKYRFIEGLYGSRQIVDPVYPLKYMVVDGVRVACTLVRSYKHLAVLISLANCTDHPIQLAVGPVSLEKLSPGRKVMEYCDPGLIDEVLEEDVILGRTWRRKTLCHIQKSRRIPGYLRNGALDPDDFFGNNEFGLYGAWASSLRDTPPIVTREQYFYDEKPKGSDQELLGFMRGNGAIHPTYIEPGAARTGLVFFLRERYEDARVRLFIGNAELLFPFHVAPGQ